MVFVPAFSVTAVVMLAGMLQPAPPAIGTAVPVPPFTASSKVRVVASNSYVIVNRYEPAVAAVTAPKVTELAFAPPTNRTFLPAEQVGQADTTDAPVSLAA